MKEIKIYGKYHTAQKEKPGYIYCTGNSSYSCVFGIRSLLHNMKYETTDNAQIESRSVPVISRVAGYIDSLGVDDYGKVKGNGADH